MNYSSNQIGLTQATVYDISAADLAGANSGQRPDLLAKTQAIFRTPDQKLYAANAARSQLVAASVPVTAETNLGTGVTDLLGPGGNKFAANGAVDVRTFGAKCDGIALYDATATNSTTSTITSATANFTSADIGKKCVTVPYVDTLAQTVRYGTITAVSSPNSCTVLLNVAPGALTGATFIYGTDDLAAYNAAIAAADASNISSVFVPGGISCLAGNLIIPMGMTLFGVGNYATGGRAKDFKYKGSSLVLVSFLAADFVTGGNGGNSPRGVTLHHLNIDCLNLATHSFKSGGRTVHVNNCTLLHGITNTIETGATSRFHMCCIFGHNDACNVVQITGDSTFTNNLVIGAGNGFYEIKTSNGDDIVITGNHLWKDAQLSSMLGGSIFVSQNSGDTKAGGITISNNKFDTAFGPHILIRVSGSSTLRGINIVGNQSMNNDAVVNGTGAFIQLEVQSGNILRCLNVHSNMVRGSWNDPTKGQHSYFLDASLTAGTVYASSLTGNVIDNVVSGGLLNFTPTYTAGNLYMVGTGTTAVAF